LLRRLLVVSALVQMGLLLVLAWWLSRSIKRDCARSWSCSIRWTGETRRPGTVPESLTQGATTRDVQHLGEAVNSLLLRLQESLSAQREFAGNVAHELRTPLAASRAGELRIGAGRCAVWRTSCKASPRPSSVRAGSSTAARARTRVKAAPD